MSREEERIALSILSRALGVVFLRIKIDPYAGWKDVLVMLVPSPIDYFCVLRVIVVPLKLLVGH